MSTRAIVLGAVLIAVTGCANLGTIGRRTDTPLNGKAIHLDAAQRLVFMNKDGWVCAEPSPDALQSYAASLGGAFSAPSKEAVSLAAAFSGNAAGIGLRTQAITLMRDALYRICEAQHNGALNSNDVMLLLARSQDLSLGVLAIEQLTGAIVARQPMLTTGANAAVSANLTSTQAALDQAKKDEAAKKTALASATDARDKQKALVAKTTQEEAAAKQKAAATQAVVDKVTAQVGGEQAQLDKDDTAVTVAAGAQTKQEERVAGIAKQLEAAKAAKDQPAIDKLTAEKKAADDQLGKNKAATAAAKKKQASQKATLDKTRADLQKAKDAPDQVAYEKVAKTLTSQKADLKTSDDKVTAAQADYEQAQKVTQALQANTDAALTTANATAEGTGSFSIGVDRNNVNKETVAEIAEATKFIVATVVNKGHLTETCASLMTRFAQESSLHSDSVYRDLMAICAEVIRVDLKAYMLMVKNQAARPPGPVPAPLPYPPAAQEPPPGLKR
jgi:hypothetical protein